MGDHFQWIAACDIEPDRAAASAASLLRWLIAEEIVLPDQTDCVLSANLGYPLGPRAGEWIEGGSAETQLWTHGVTVHDAPTVFTPGQGYEWASHCVWPICGGVSGEDFFEEAVQLADQFHVDRVDVGIDCPVCAKSSPIRQWRYEQPTWAFASAGITIWNQPPLVSTFMARVAELTGSRVAFGGGKL